MLDPIATRGRTPRLVDIGNVDTTVATDEGDLVCIFLDGDNINIVGTPTELLDFAAGISSAVYGILREREQREQRERKEPSAA